MPESLHRQLLKNFIDAGLEDRLMLGTDNMPLGAILNRLNGFEFLSEQQRTKINYENAARFFN
jgi:predicted TIM-barrel fold metal-dependent hydrolase